jgi:hypothetical protein
MVARRTIDFLPKIFQTETNKRFLNATVDQLVQEPKMKRLSGFIGRGEGSPVYRSTDAYVKESNAIGQYYQLEPSLVIRKPDPNIENDFQIQNVYSYLDLLNKVSSLGGIVSNHDRLFNQEYYNYQGFINIEKLVNYSEYYWVPRGPDPVNVNAAGVDVEKTFNVSRPYAQDLDNNQFKVVTGLPSYNFAEIDNDANPTITLIRGGTYQFKVNQPGYPFFIQTEPGTNEFVDYQQNISKRDVKGVDNNGSQAGTITFKVPKKDSQDQFLNMEQFDTIDFVITAPFNQVQGIPVETFLKRFSFDGIATDSFIKKVVFTDINDETWFKPSNFDAANEFFDSNLFDRGDSIDKDKRKGVWQLVVDDNGLLDARYLYDWPSLTKIFVREGRAFGSRSIYKDATLTIKLVPNITANLDTFYYQDGIDEDIFGVIKLIDPGPNSILDINSIIGQKTYVSPNGVKFTNGLKVKFNQIVTPDEYQDEEYIVEGVGKSITLHRWRDFITPEKYTIDQGSGYDASGEFYDSLNFDFTFNAPIEKEYITISRASVDGNPWSRGNRWFHKDVLNYSASILTPNETYNFDESYRGKRPIIEFRDNLQLFQTGNRYLTKVFVVDTQQTDAFSNVEGMRGYFVDGVELLNGVSIVFPNDNDVDVRKTVYDVELIDPVGNGIKQVHLVPRVSATEGNNIVVFSGVANQGKMYCWKENVEAWVETQQKTFVNQDPLFEMINRSRISFGNNEYYPSTSFTGAKLFSYRKSLSGNIDPELRFVVTYKTIGNIGDILFDNNFDKDTFSYSVDKRTVLVNINTGNVERYDPTEDRYFRVNPWVAVDDYSGQYIEKKFVSQIGLRNDFDLRTLLENSTTEKIIFVTVNNQKREDFILVDNGSSNLLRFDQQLNIGDIVLVQVYGKSLENSPIYTIPKNLEKNSKNDVFESITLGQMRKHLIEMSKNNLDFKGEPAGNNNLRDINYLSSSGSILQHSAPVPFAQLMFNNQSTDIIESINYSRREYSRFKQTFFELLETLQFKDVSNAKECFDELMSVITESADPSKPFYYSDMVAYGKNFQKTVYIVFDPFDRSFTTVESYNYNSGETSLYKDLLVYVNNHQLIKDKDYVVNNKVITIKDTFDLNVEDTVEIYEYSSTKGCMIPATPSKLGMYPKYVPEKYLDNTIIDENVESKFVIQGHDGSIMMAFNDYRDNIILEYEKRVFNNIHVDYYYTLPDYNSVAPTAFRETEYTFDEWTQLLSLNYLEWAGTNNVDIYTNSTTSNDVFSLNYAEATDKIKNELLPGYWRGIYNYFYGTDRPHTHPWEIAGWLIKPDNWDLVYGSAPYTSGNLILWQDLEDGIYYDPEDGQRKVDPLYIRKGLTKIIPVDENGFLLPPTATVIDQYNSLTGSNSWRFGDYGPQETAWRRSSEFPFSTITAYHLAKPAEAVAFCWNTKDYIYDVFRDENLRQIINVKNNNRKFTSEITNENVNITGSNIWVRDRLAALGLDIKENLIDIIDNYDINLSYKLSGFTDKKYLQILAEQSSPQSTNTSVLVPQENYSVALTKSAPVNRVTYSAVVIEKKPDGFLVAGFDTFKPFFTVIPSIINNNNYTITVANQSAIIYKDGEGQTLQIPYGSILRTRQQVVDFLISYGRYLESQGFIFDNLLPDLLTKNDWSLAAKEFLFFSQQGWDDTTVIGLSPVGGSIEFNNGFSVVDAISNGFNSTRIIDSDYQNLTGKDYRVYRQGTNFSINLKNSQKSVYLLDIEAVQYEHTLVFDNNTVFNDTIYENVLGDRQQRLKFEGRKTAEWDGSLSAPGFLVNHRPVDSWLPMTDYYKGEIVKFKKKFFTASAFIPGKATFDQNDWYELDNSLLNQRLIPAPSFNAQQFEDFYDIDINNVNTSADLQSRHATGFQPRKYFNDIGLSNISQQKFYLGMIREKGTNSAISKFLRAKLPYIENDIDIVEEWAWKLGSYGNTENLNEIELSLDKIKQSNSTAILELLNSNDVRNKEWNTFKVSDFISVPNGYNKDIFSVTDQRKQKYDTTGNVLLSEISATVFDVNKLSNLNVLVPSFGEGSTIWFAADKDNDWNIYRLSNVNNNPILVEANNNILKFTTFLPHKLQVADKVVVKRAFISQNEASINVSGIYNITEVTAKTFSVVTPVNIVNFSNSPLLSAVMFKMDSIKFANKTLLADYTPFRGWNHDDYAYIEDVNGKWQTLENTKAWDYIDTLSPITVTADDNFGKNAVLSSDERFAIVSSNENNGKVYLYVRDEFNTWAEAGAIQPSDVIGEEFGYSIAVNDDYKIFAGAPATNAKGAVYILKNNFGSADWDQVIYDPTMATDARFGSDIAASKNGEWLYIAAEQEEKIFAYKLNRVETYTRDFIADGIASSFYVPIEVLDSGLAAEQIKVFVNNDILVPYVDYTMDVLNEQVILSTTPSLGTEIKVVFSDYYEYVTVINNPSSVNSFAKKIRTTTDGRDLLVSAHTSSRISNGVTYTNAGMIYVYRRTVENFISNGATTSYTTTYTPNNPSVYIDDVFTSNWQNVGSTFALSNTPNPSSIVSFETNNFVLVEALSTEIPFTDSEFGYDLVFCPNNCSIYVGAPGLTTSVSTNGGVYRFINIGRTYGTVKGKVQNPFVNIGDSIFINDYKITFTDRSLTAVVDQINNSNIPGVSAFDDDGYLVVTTNSLLTFNKLKITNGIGTAVLNLGLELFPQVQLIESVFNQDGLRFGQKISINTTANKLTVASSTANNNNLMTLDGGETSFDRKVTVFRDTIYRSGAVYLYEYLQSKTEEYNDIGKFAYADKFSKDTIKSNDAFGTAVSIGNQWTIITSPRGKVNNEEKGVVDFYYNETSTTVWQVIREFESAVDTNKFNRAFIYNKKTNSIEIELPLVDSINGIHLPNVIENIDFDTNYDPAVYNAIPNSIGFNRDSKNAWGQEKVGTIWWDTNALKYLDWNQGDLKNKANLKDILFPSSAINMYMWIESDLPPSQYNIENVNNTSRSLYTLNEIFSNFIISDPVTQESQNKYYFWVKLVPNGLDIYSNESKVTELFQSLVRPRSTNVPFVSIISTNVLALYNCSNYLGNDYVLKIEYNKSASRNPVHTEWNIFPDNSKTNISLDVYQKIIDSIAGEDTNGRLVPDKNLKDKQKYGLNTSPRQTIFADVVSARKLFVDFTNEIFQKYPVRLIRTIDQLLASDPYPSVDFYDDEVEDDVELSYLSTALFANKTILVKNDSLVGGWTLRKLEVFLRNGNFEYEWVVLKARKFDNRNGWKYADWYAESYSAETKATYEIDYSYEVNSLLLKNNDIVKIKNSTSGGFQLIKIVNGAFELIGQEAATIQINQSLYDYVDAGFGIETQSFESISFSQDNAIEIRNIVDAVFSILNQSAGAFVNEFRAYYKELLSLYIRLINTQFIEADWLLKTSFISINHNIRRLDQIPYYVKQPEKVVEDYINEVKPYHTKIREYRSTYPGKDNADLNVSDFDLPPYLSGATNKFKSPQLEDSFDTNQFTQAPWNNWFKNYKSEIDYIDIINGGTGYTNDTVVKIEGNATARVKVRANGEIYAVILVNPGSDYTQEPKITLEGTGTGAILNARLKNQKVRSIKSTIKFDRFTRSISIPDWVPGATYIVGDKFIYNFKPYRVIEAHTSSTVSPDLLKSVEIIVKNWDQYTRYNKYDIVVKNWGTREYYEALEDLVTTNLFDTKNLISYNGYIIDNAIDRTWAYYNPTIGMPGRNLAQLMTGLEYPGVFVTGPTFDSEPGFDVGNFDLYSFDIDSASAGDGIGSFQIDSILNGQFLDSNLGVRPEDIIHDGAGFVDQYNSHAPEELIPGRMFDALDIKVVTNPSKDVALPVNAPDVIVNSYDGNNQTYFEFNTKDAVVGTVEKLIVYTSDLGYLREGVDFSVNWVDKAIITTSPILDNDKIFIVVIGSTGEGIIENFEFYGDGSTSIFNLKNMKSDIVKQVYVKVNGSLAENFEIQTDEYGYISVVFETAPANNDYIQAHTYNVPDTRKAFSSIVEQTYTIRKTVDVSFTRPSLNIPFYTYSQAYTDYVAENYVATGKLITNPVTLSNNGLTQTRSGSWASVQDKAIFDSDPVIAAERIARGAYNIANGIVISGFVGQDDSELAFYPTDYTFTLPETIQYTQPWNSNIIVRVNNETLTPANNKYYSGDGSSVSFSIPTTPYSSDSTIADNDIIVVVDNIKQEINIDYTLIRDGSSLPIVQFLQAPADNSRITISDSSKADYKVVDDRTLLISESLLIKNSDAANIKVGDKITVIMFSNHDMYDTRTEVFVGVTNTSIFLGGYDKVGYDAVDYDSDTVNIVGNPRYQLSRDVNNIDRLMVFRNGGLLIPYDQYSLPTLNEIQLDRSLAIASTDVITVYHLSDDIRYPLMTFRIFKNMLDEFDYLGISEKHSTELVQDLNQSDTVIYVADASRLSEPGITSNQPGVVFIDGERITYWVKNNSDNTLGQIRRSTGGTGSPVIHVKGSKVEDGGITMRIPQEPNTIWYNLDTNGQIGPDGSTLIVKTVGESLQDSTTNAANFLKEISR